MPEIIITEERNEFNMAIREIRVKDDEILYKKCKEVVKFDEKLHILLDDMYETMNQNNGVGLAAPQVGILKRAVIVDVGDGVIELINPVIIEANGTQNGPEGCLSVPNVFGQVERPMYVKVRAQDRNGEWFEVEGEELKARAFCHEIEHLEGKLFLDRVTEFLED